jgi:serine protease
MNARQMLKLAAKVASGTIPEDVMPSRVIRFALEYAQQPDPAAERVRLEALLESPRFTLELASSDPEARLSRFLVLQFPGVERTLSPQMLFEMANALAEDLGLVSCEPDIGARVYGEPDASPLAPTRPESAIVDLWCRSRAPAPVDARWALASIRAKAAWALSPAMGAGILIGQPDTGVATHPEIEAGALALDKAKNILEGGTDPSDPLSPSMANPGHGTATSSVVISRQAGTLAGSAPGARLAPIRCIDDVKIFNGIPVAAAIAHARSVGCDIVTMSLGGIQSSSLAAAIADAVGHGMIVLAAAGNCVGWVVYPASDPNVIAVAGSNIDDKRWKGSSFGTKIDVAAPAENVYVARRQPGDGGVAAIEGGQGTSYAVALTAGVAALWLAHHGRGAVRAEAQGRRINVQELFRAALRHSARRPTGMDPIEFGAGIVDAEALLKLRLTDIPAFRRPAPPAGDIETIAALAADRATVDGFDWARHGAEATWLAGQAAKISRLSQAGMETIGGGVLKPSAAVERTAPPVLRKLFGTASSEVPMRTVASSATSPERYIKILGKTAGGGLESAAAVTVEEGRQRLTGPHRRDLVRKLDGVMRSLPSDAAVVAERNRLTEDADNALRRLGTEGVRAPLSVRERVALEALVSIHDRPALRVRDGAVDPGDPLLGDWGGSLLPGAAALKPLLGAVGRIDLDGQHVGTGFVVAPGCIMTNRHVLEALAAGFRAADGATIWAFAGTPTVNFADDARGDAKRFKIKSVIAAGPDSIDEIIDFAHLDLALLEVETTNAAGADLPKAIKIVLDPDTTAVSSQLLVCGYPARPGMNALRDPETGQVRDDVVARLGQIFGLAYSVKYLSPGEIDVSTGGLSTDLKRWVLAHDATTLGGHSGSCALYFGEPLGLVGLHFGGGTLRANYAHSLAAVKASGLLANVLTGRLWA